jgi:hypothetical protein
MFGSLSTQGRSPKAAILRKLVKPLGTGLLRWLTPIGFLAGYAFGQGKPAVRLAAVAALLPALAVTLKAIAEAAFESRRDIAIFVAGWAVSFLLGKLALTAAAKDLASRSDASGSADADAE